MQIRLEEYLSAGELTELKDKIARAEERARVRARAGEFPTVGSSGVDFTDKEWDELCATGLVTDKELEEMMDGLLKGCGERFGPVELSVQGRRVG